MSSKVRFFFFLMTVYITMEDSRQVSDIWAIFT